MMYKLKISQSNTIILFILLLVITSCTTDQKFNQQKWLANSDVNDRNNPRADMTDDLLNNHLKVGLSKNAVLALLGKPEKDGIENRLPKGVKMPDSLALTNEENLKPEHREKVTAKINDFMRLNAKAQTLMLYPVGWSTIDPNFLVIQLDDKGLVLDFWLEQH